MEIIKELIPILTILGQIITLILLLAIIFKTEKITKFFGNHALLFSFIISAMAVIGSLFYSEVLGYTPCTLCWYQRILIYPQALVFLFAMYRKDNSVFRHMLPLSVLGLIVSGYHYLLQRGLAPSLDCDAVGYSVACSKQFVLTYGYMTIPLMAFTAFFLLILLHFVNKKYSL